MRRAIQALEIPQIKCMLIRTYLDNQLNGQERLPVGLSSVLLRDKLEEVLQGRTSSTQQTDPDLLKVILRREGLSQAREYT